MRIHLLALIIVFWTSYSWANPTKPVAVDIKADRVEIDQKKGRVEFSGSVRVSRGSLVISCQTLIARYRKDGTIVGLSIDGQLSVQGQDFSAQAGGGTYEHDTGRLILTGSPKIKRGPHHMIGERIVVFIDDERVVVERARGRLSVPLNDKTPR